MIKKFIDTTAGLSGNNQHITIILMIKKFIDTTAGLAFTLAGSAVVFITLSGDTRRIAMISTGVAVLVHYTYELTKKD